MGTGFDGATLLITGGTGTFGNAVLRRFLRHRHRRDPHLQPRREEAGRHAARVRTTRKLKFYIGDVRDPDSLRDAMDGRGLRLPRRRAEAGALLRVLSAWRRC